MIRNWKQVLATAALLAVPLLLAAQAVPQEEPAAPQERWERPSGRRGPGMGSFGTGMGMGMGMQQGMGMAEHPAIRERLGLTDQQVERLRSMRLEFAKARIPQRAELRVKRLELAELLRADAPDRGQVERKMREINELEFAARRAAVNHGLAVREVFTPEQRAELKKLAAERRAQRMEMRRGGMGRGGSGRRGFRGREFRGPGPQGPGQPSRPMPPERPPV